MVLRLSVLLRTHTLPSVSAVSTCGIHRLRRLQRLDVRAWSSAEDPFGNKDQAKAYALYRPKYNDNIIKQVVAACQGRDFAADLCTGTGQIAIPLAQYFKQVKGYDRSSEQLKNVESTPRNLEFVQVDDVCSLTSLNQADVDLVTVAQALHWLDLEAIFSEVKRVLHPERGVFAVLGYAVPSLQSSDAAEQLFKDYYFKVLGSDKAPGSPGCYWAIDRRALDAGYPDYPFSKAFSQVERDWFPNVQKMSLSAFMGYLGSMSAYHAYMKDQGGAVHDPLHQLHKKLKGVLKCDEVLEVSVPYFLVLCRP